MTGAWTLVCVAVGWTTLCLLAADLLRSPYWRMRRRLRAAATGAQSDLIDSGGLFAEGRLAGADDDGPSSAIGRLLEQAGLPVSVGHFTVASIASAGLGMVIGLLAAPLWAWPPMLLFGAAPWSGLLWLRKRRIERLRRELPEAFDIMRRAVEAGQTVASAFQQVATQLRGALAREFQRCGEQQSLGLSQDAALRELARRVPIVELDIFVIALLIQRQCGGSPVEILSNMSALIRKRLRLDQRVQALTAEGRLQAIVLTVLPIAAFLGLTVLRPDYVDPLLQRPQLLGLLALWQTVGMVWVRQTVRLEY